MHTECRVRFRDAASAADRGAAGARCRQRNPSCLAGGLAAGTCAKAAARARRGGGAALAGPLTWPAAAAGLPLWAGGRITVVGVVWCWLLRACGVAGL